MQNLQKSGIEDVYVRSYINKKEVVIYFEPGIRQILSEMEFPNIEMQDTIDVRCEMLIDVWRKSIVDLKVIAISDGLTSVEAAGDIEIQIFKYLNIKTQNVNIFNLPKLNIRGERNMAYVGIDIRIIGEYMYIDWPYREPFKLR